MISTGTHEMLAAAPLPEAPTAVEPVGGRDRRARPVVAAQGGLDLVAADVVDLGGAAAGRRRGHQEGIGPILGGDREDGVFVCRSR